MAGRDVIHIRDLRVTYKQAGRPAHEALKGLSLTVREGETFGFLGPNGAGKTTTMNVLLGFVQPTGGSAAILGVDVGNPAARARIGYLPELTYYYRFLTGEELLRFYGRLFGMRGAALDARVAEVLKLVDMQEAGKRLIRGYSKGMQQRVGLAQALINDPELLILDEPTSGLDPLGRMTIRDIIQRLRDAGKTVFFSSHELGEVETVCDRVCIVHQGTLRAEGTVAELTRGRGNLEEVFLDVVGYRRGGAA